MSLSEPVFRIQPRSSTSAKILFLKSEMESCRNYIDGNIDGCGEGMVRATNSQENDGGVKVLGQKDETKNKKSDYENWDGN